MRRPHRPNQKVQVTSRSARNLTFAVRLQKEEKNMGGDPILNIISQIISTALVYVVLKVNDIPWKKWQLILGAILVGLAVNMLTNISTIFVAPLFQINMIVTLIVSAGLMTLIGWPIFSLLRANGRFVGAAKGFACAVSYAFVSIIFLVVKGFVL